MNTAMLKCLVDLAEGSVEVIDKDEFFRIYPMSPGHLRDLATLERAGFINVLRADDDVEEIAVNKSAVDYFK